MTSSPLASVDRVRVQLGFDPAPARLRVEVLRGAVAGLFPGTSLFHQHAVGGEDQGRVLNRYPLVQYRVDEDRGEIVALGEAAEVCRRYDWSGRRLRLGRCETRVCEVLIRSDEVHPAQSERLVRYAFEGPWLAFNSRNHRRYEGLDPEARRGELDRILTAHLLALLTGLGARFPGRLLAAFEPGRAVRRSFKGVPLRGFLGQFVANLELPDGMALGKATSHGFGVIRRLDPPPPPPPNR